MSEFFEASAKEKSRVAARSGYGRVAWRDPVRSAGERWPVLAPGPDQCVRGNDGRAGKNRRSADRREGVRARLQNRHRLLHCQLWCYESHLQPVCRSSFGNRWPQEGFGSRLAAWPSCPVHHYFCQSLVLVRCGERDAWRQPGIVLVDDGDYEGGFGWPEAPWVGARAERVRRLPCPRIYCLDYRLHRVGLRSSAATVLSRYRRGFC